LPRKQIEAIKAEQGEMVYAGQYGQKPTPREGGMFKIDRLNIIHSVPAGEVLTRVVRYWDKAGTKRKTSAYTVGVKMGVVEWTQNINSQNITLRKYYVLDVVRFKERAGEREKIIQETAKMDGP
jgi:phage terminase large subunit-like protein